MYNARPRSKAQKRRRLAFDMLALLVLLVGGLAALNTAQSNNQAKQQAGQSSGSRDTVSESKPDDTSNYQVAADLPRFLTISTIGVQARVVKLGVQANNQLQAPTNIYDAGWYKQSAKPGQPGAVVIDGHVHGPTKPGVFYKLAKLKTGDEISLQTGDGRNFTYLVVKLHNYPYDHVDMAAALKPVEPNHPGLNLITCGGRYNKQLSQYEERTVIFATQKT